MTITETIARAIAKSFGVKADVFPRYEKEAQAAITALTEAGYAILPVEPTMFQLVKLGAPGGTLEERGVDPGDQPLYDIYAAVIAGTPDHIMPAIQTVGPLDSERGE